ncbi:MAG TPA: carbohydrate ABC transporter permease [Clostridia bacterium]|nr:carbohydrate ABC transporter permease [Clostridia bacterium]
MHISPSFRARRVTSDLLFDAILTVLGVVLLAIIAYPLYFVILASFSNPQQIAAGKVWLWTNEFTVYGYSKVFENARIWVGYRNTVLYTALGTIFHLAVTLSGAYTLSRRDLMLRGPLMLLFTITMFFSGGLVPTYLILKSYGMLDTVWVMTLPGCISVYNLIIARTFFQNNVPGELLDAAQIDGCTDFRFFFQIVLPLSQAILAVIALYQAVGLWNSYMDGLIYLRSDERLPLQLVLREILVINSSSESTMSGSGEDVLLQLREQIKYCVIVVSTLPLLTVYPFLQKHFNKGVMIGAIKG